MDTFLWLVTFVSAENEIIDSWFKIKGIFRDLCLENHFLFLETDR